MCVCVGWGVWGGGGVSVSAIEIQTTGLISMKFGMGLLLYGEKGS